MTNVTNFTQGNISNKLQPVQEVLRHHNMMVYSNVVIYVTPFQIGWYHIFASINYMID
jgi:hypothetical protein